MSADLLWAAPFALLLGAIAVLPLTRKHWWEKNFALVSFGLAAVVACRYAFLLRDTAPLGHTALEYFSFIVLIGSLFTVSGGIHIRVKGEATPAVNCLYLLIGAVLANLLGTTGASMVLVRPWLRMNKYRLTAHHVVFFIFIVSNVGGGLTPIGDPPLFLGYLRGVPFFWVLSSVWPIWAMTLALLLAIFFVIDSRNFLRAPKEVRAKETAHETWKFDGAHNVLFLAMILGSVFIGSPPFLREAVMIAAAVLSYKTTPKDVHESNDFNFGPIKEVAILFAGIFVTMLPALEWLERNADGLGIRSPGQFYWGSGVLSSVLDNAPTYLNFLAAAQGLFHAGEGHAGVAALLAEHPAYIRAISVGSVFFGAVTYIGNGPNFLVKSIADQQKAHTPSFFGYFFRYSLPVLIPVFGLVWFLFFRAA
ncbi:MAG TPA: sodium:proton antiporter [Candidatus Eisenbacteria bacterium]|nr:sodium:proton antiporter [Candidatus Eisenbacteria bacterium]